MTITEEIEQLKVKLEKTADEREQAEVLLEMLGKYPSLNRSDAQYYIDRLLQLAEKLNEPLYKAWGLFQLAVFKKDKGEYDNSINISQQAMSLFRQFNELKGIAATYSNIGIVYEKLSNYPQALKNHSASLKIKEEIGDKLGIAKCYHGMGNSYENQGNYPEALKNYFASLKIAEEIGDKLGIGMSYNGIGIAYEKQGNYSESLKNHFASLKIAEEIGNKGFAAYCYGNIGIVYQVEHNYTEALRYFFIALKILEELGDKFGIGTAYNGIGNVYLDQGNYPEALKSYRASLKIRKKIGEKRGIATSYSNIGAVYYEQGNYNSALSETLKGLKMAEQIGFKDLIKDASLLLNNTYKALDDFKNALKYHEKYHQIESEMIGEQAQKQLTNLNFQHNMEQKEKDLEIEQLRNVELKKERDRSEALLLNILPVEVAEELKEKGKASAKLFDDVTVLYTDFQSFTTVTETLSPQALVDELNVCFSAFDDIMGKYNIEKIKTVGDAYLAVSGLPLSCPDHASCVVNAAIEIREFIKNRRMQLGDKTFDIRIGVHSGSVVAGIVGVKKYAYDIWGDTVNTAARMEQSSEPGKINISDTTYQLVKDKFNCTYRGEHEAKNKGWLKMYFVEN